MTTLKDILVLLAILLCYGIAGRMDYEDAVRHEEFMRGISVETHVCRHDISSTSTEAPTARIGDFAAANADRDCETTPL